MDLFFQSAAKVKKTGQLYDFQASLSSKQNVKRNRPSQSIDVNLLIYINVIFQLVHHTFAVIHKNMTKITLDILAFGAHPDDVEISCGATLIRSVEEGKKLGIIDLTGGELGSRGTQSIRREEAKRAGDLIGLTIRENLEFRDCFFINDETHRMRVIEKLRQYRPEIVLVNSPSDRHPDHGRASQLVREACFYSGLAKIETFHEGVAQQAWRPRSVFMYIQDYFLEPSFVVDISEYWDKKRAALQCYSSQFFDPTSTEPKTPISGEEFFDFLYGKALNLGRPCGFTLGEGFIVDRYPGVRGLSDIL